MDRGSIVAENENKCARSARVPPWSHAQRRGAQAIQRRGGSRKRRQRASEGGAFAKNQAAVRPAATGSALPGAQDAPRRPQLLSQAPRNERSHKHATATTALRHHSPDAGQQNPAATRIAVDVNTNTKPEPGRGAATAAARACRRCTRERPTAETPSVVGTGACSSRSPYTHAVPRDRPDGDGGHPAGTTHARSAGTEAHLQHPRSVGGACAVFPSANPGIIVTPLPARGCAVL